MSARFVLPAAAVLACLSAMPAFGQDAQPAAVTGVLDAVTVYRGQALVSRLVDVPAGAQPIELVVTNLPERVAPGSLYAEPIDGALVRSVTYRVRPVSDDVREEVRKFDEQIVVVHDAMAANVRQAQVLAERKNYLDHLEQFQAPTAAAELKSGVLNAETLKNLTLFVFEQRQSIATDELKAATEQRGLQEKLNLLQRQRSEVAGSSARSAREAVVLVQPAPAAAKIRLRYVVDGATWSPSYNVRAGDDRKTAGVEYNAAVQQMSGEDWSNVTMTLSTATPSLVAAAPKLDPLAIDLVAVSPERAAIDYAQKKLELKERLKGAESMRNSYAATAPTTMPGQVGGVGGGMGGGAIGGSSFNGDEFGARQNARQQADVDLNELAGELQKLELVDRDSKDKAADRAGWGLAPSNEQSVSVTYELPGRTSLPSRSDRQIIQIAAMPMGARFYKLAVPVLTSSVYDQATLVNDGKIVLLAGPVSSYLGGQFVGAGQIPTISAGETFTVGFGIDASLRASREQLDKTDSTQAGNKVLDFSYKLTVENFSGTPANVRLLDRIPTSKDPNVKITQVSSTVPVSKDDSYTEAERKQGILRWDVQVAAGAAGAKAAAVEHKYRIEHDRQLTIGGMASR